MTAMPGNDVPGNGSDPDPLPYPLIHPTSSQVITPQSGHYPAPVRLESFRFTQQRVHTRSWLIADCCLPWGGRVFTILLQTHALTRIRPLGHPAFSAGSPRVFHSGVPKQPDFGRTRRIASPKHLGSPDKPRLPARPDFGRVRRTESPSKPPGSRKLLLV